MTKISIKLSPGDYEKFKTAHQYFLNQYYPNFGGPTLANFILLCAVYSCNDILAEMGEGCNED